MAKFYRGILKDEERTAAASEPADRDVEAEKMWSPYYGAAFTMQGEWR